VRRLIRTVIEIFRLAVARESLPAPRDSAPRPVTRRTALRSLFAHEELPLDPEAPRGARRAGFRALFRREELAIETEAPPRAGGGLLRSLFAAEPLPSDPPVDRPRRSPWLAWLFAPERIDPP